MARAKYEKWIEDENLILIKGWKSDGLSDEQIAKNMGVAYSTLREWKKKYPALSAVFKKGKEHAIREVENALFKIIKGYECEEIIREVDSNGRKHEKRVKKFVKPDTTAIIFYLKTQAPDKWLENREEREAKIKLMRAQTASVEADTVSESINKLDELLGKIDGDM